MIIENDASGLAAPPNPAPWDLPESLQQFDSVDEAEILHEVISAYLTDGAQRIEQLRRTAANGQLEEFFAQAHSFKGSSHQMGATQIAKICESLELKGSLSSQPELLAAVAQMEASFQGISQAMFAYLAAAHK